jgi:hypothetical protein
MKLVTLANSPTNFHPSAAFELLTDVTWNDLKKKGLCGEFEGCALNWGYAQNLFKS